MAKRFTDTNKYKKPFIRGLKGAYKLFWDYLYHDCDHAGIWIVDFEIAQLYVGKDMPITKELALLYFNDKEERIVEFDNGEKWFIPSFIEFQYGQLNPANRAHNSVISILEKNNLYKNKPLTSPLQEASFNSLKVRLIVAREEFEQKGMNSAQLTGSTSSYARKYALNGLFAIDDTKDDDFNNTHDKPVKPTVKKAPQTPPVVPTFDIKDIQTKIDACKSVEELMGIWADNKSLQANDAFVKILTTKKRQLNESK